MKTIHDAPHLNDFQDPIRVTINPKKRFPIRQDLTAIEYDVTFAQRSEFFRPSKLGIRCPDNPNARLYAETDPADIQGGLVQFTRSFSTIPATRVEFEKGTFQFPELRSVSTEDPYRASFSAQVIFKIIYSYIYTEDPENDLVLEREFRPTDTNGAFVDFVASDTSPNGAEYQTKIAQKDYINSAETDVARWRGNIWQMKNFLVVAR